MTEQRFKNVEEKLYWGTVQYFTYNDEKITDEEIEKLVNHLLNQNEQLKNENQKLDEKIFLITRDLIKTKSYEQLEKELNRIKNENEELKKELKVYRKLANCSNCKYQNYDWFEDGDEFEICEKGNNNQQMEYSICKECEEF